MQHGSESRPFIAVLDEAQNLSHGDDSPSGKILTEGRKLGWSAWYATQSLNVMSDDEVTRLSQAAYQIYFRPTDIEVKKISEMLDHTNKNKWISSVSSLTKGRCIVAGDRIKPNGTFGAAQPVEVSVTQLADRE